MKCKFDAIKMEEKVLSINTNETNNMYIVKMDYESLIKICGVGKVSINREVDPSRARKMVKYIRKQESFYPPLIVATTKKNLIIYDEIEKTICIESDKLNNNHDILVIDGQHRYTSIKYLNEENEELIKNRYQSIFLIDNLNEFQQRKIFIDINNTAKKVTTGTKLRLERNIINYISLRVVDNDEKIQKKIAMDENQTSSIEDIPYKFIIRGNEKLLKRIDDDFDKDIINLEDVDKVLDAIYLIWEDIFNIIDIAVSDGCDIITNEAFYIAICEYLQSIFNLHIYDNIKKDIDSGNFKAILINITNKIKNKIKYIDSEYYKLKLNRTKERSDKIFELIDKVVGEGEEHNA